MIIAGQIYQDMQFARGYALMDEAISTGILLGCKWPLRKIPAVDNFCKDLQNIPGSMSLAPVSFELRAAFTGVRMGACGVEPTLLFLNCLKELNRKYQALQSVLKTLLLPLLKCELQNDKNCS